VASLVLAASGVWSARRPAAVKRVRVPLTKLRRELDGYIIAQISDVHVGPTIGRTFVEDLVRRMNAMGADMIAITGDLVDGSVAELGPIVAPLAGLVAKDGVFFVTGNHEYYSGAREWCSFLESIGIRVLRNQRAALREGLLVIGVDDWSARRFGERGADLRRALEGRDESSAVVLLAHQPKAVVEAEELGVDLQLSGHTHGGQLVPWNFLVKLQQPYVSGLHAHGRTLIYVSNGTGYWGPPMRVGAPAEITRIELVSAI
jgi:predicted MPP superfamily phosphohydrolase